ncbi:MAG TPA: cyclic nucleotide-binding domain-containing protein [Chitinophagales bacterium]|nr:cyclic nucleotide-binding domain-containing protein [Chitinophagales bacterium]
MSDFDKNTLGDILSKSAIFRHLAPEIIQLIAEKIIISSYEANDRIIKKGDRGDSMYIVLKGKVKVHDQEHTIAEMGDHDFFGELSLFDSEPRSMSVSAKEPSSVGVIQRDDFIRILNEHPEIIVDIIKVLTKRLRSQNRLLVSEYEAREDELKKLVAQRTAELENKNLELTQALEDLERSQAQLVQQARLASLGQLAAGIAHEIQNPLNFVNNFSELSQELIDEIRKSKSEEERKGFLKDLKQNLEKIHQHGQRADGIVKSILDHSRTSSGDKQLTDINVLCEEFFSLAYQGIRVNHPDFNCTVEKHFDIKLPKVNVVPQDISRVLLNLFNNAFYAVREKTMHDASFDKLRTGSNTSSPDLTGIHDSSRSTAGIHDKIYQPVVSVTTLQDKSNETVTISVRDNGEGIPDDIKEKIFQPFFTTKPTGQGTGLGLSLSYDIIKAHGGDLRAESEKGKFTEFKIILPL